MLLSVPNGEGPPIELVRFKRQGCRDCVVADSPLPALHCGMALCVDETGSYVWLLATPENLAQAVLDRMNNETNPTP